MSMIENEIKEGTPCFKKGDAFVETASHPLVFMEINEVQESTGCMDFCIVSWYNLNEKGLHAQQRFLMGARNGKFSDFEPIPRSLFNDAKSLIRQYDAAVKQSTDKKEAKSLYKEYNKKLIELLPDAEERLTLAQLVEKEIVTNTWLDCDEDNYWVEEDSEQDRMYITLVCVTSESCDDKDGNACSEQYFYLRDNCPYSWNTLAKCGAKYMVIEKPKK